MADVKSYKFPDGSVVTVDPGSGVGNYSASGDIAASVAISVPANDSGVTRSLSIPVGLVTGSLPDVVLRIEQAVVGDLTISDTYGMVQSCVGDSFTFTVATGSPSISADNIEWSISEGSESKFSISTAVASDVLTVTVTALQSNVVDYTKLGDDATSVDVAWDTNVLGLTFKFKDGVAGVDPSQTCSILLEQAFAYSWQTANDVDIAVGPLSGRDVEYATTVQDTGFTLDDLSDFLHKSETSVLPAGTIIPDASTGGSSDSVFAMVRILLMRDSVGLFPGLIVSYAVKRAEAAESTGIAVGSYRTTFGQVLSMFTVNYAGAYGEEPDAKWVSSLTTPSVLSAGFVDNYYHIPINGYICGDPDFVEENAAASDAGGRLGGADGLSQYVAQIGIAIEPSVLLSATPTPTKFVIPLSTVQSEVVPTSTDSITITRTSAPRILIDGFSRGVRNFTLVSKAWFAKSFADTSPAGALAFGPGAASRLSQYPGNVINYYSTLPGDGASWEYHNLQDYKGLGIFEGSSAENGVPAGYHALPICYSASYYPLGGGDPFRVIENEFKGADALYSVVLNAFFMSGGSLSVKSIPVVAKDGFLCVADSDYLDLVSSDVCGAVTSSGARMASESEVGVGAYIVSAGSGSVVEDVTESTKVPVVQAFSTVPDYKALIYQREFKLESISWSGFGVQDRNKDAFYTNKANIGPLSDVAAWPAGGFYFSWLDHVNVEVGFVYGGSVLTYPITELRMLGSHTSRDYSAHPGQIFTPVFSLDLDADVITSLSIQFRQNFTSGAGSASYLTGQLGAGVAVIPLEGITSGSAVSSDYLPLMAHSGDMLLRFGAATAQGSGYTSETITTTAKYENGSTVKVTTTSSDNPAVDGGWIVVPGVDSLKSPLESLSFDVTILQR